MLTVPPWAEATPTLFTSYSSNTGWGTYPLPASPSSWSANPEAVIGRSLAITVPAVGAYLSGSPTVDRTWCPSGTVGDNSSILFSSATGNRHNRAAKTVERLLSVFAFAEQQSVRRRVAKTLRYVVSAVVLPRSQGGRVAAVEILKAALAPMPIWSRATARGKTCCKS